MKLLCIDDSKGVHAFIQQCFQGCEVELERAFNGREGIQKWRNGTFDLIVLDWEMPVLNGPDTFSELSQLGNQIPVMMLTSKNSPSDIEQMLKAGVQDYVMKPFTPDILIAKVEELTGRTVERVLKNAGAR